MTPMLTSKSRILRNITPQQRRLAIGTALLFVLAVTPTLLLTSSRQRDNEVDGRMCPCDDVERAKKELEEFKANRTREDNEASLKGTATIGPLQRTVRVQMAIIQEQDKELALLREAARARAELSTPEARRSKEYQKFVIAEDNPRLFTQRTFRRHAAFGFVAYSGYRLSLTMVVVAGVGAYRDRDKRRLQSCVWVSEKGERTEGKLSLETMNEHHEFLYEFLVLNCTLPHPKENTVDGWGEGGSSHVWKSREGGYLEVLMDQELWYPYVEKGGYTIHKPDSPGPFEHKYAFCGPPMFGTLSLPGILQWIAYHRYHVGFSHFYLYDSGAFTPDFILAFQQLKEEGVVTVTDFREAFQYDVWAQNQALAMHDCLYRTRETAQWTFFHDLDEYLEAPAGTTVPAILKQYSTVPYLTHGSYVYSMDKCEQKDVWSTKHDRYAVEMMLYRWDKPYCIKENTDPNLCVDYLGMRKVIANPRKVIRTYIHHTNINIGDVPGVDLPVPELWHSHFKRLSQPDRACTKEPETSDSLKKVTSLADIAAKARACAREGFTNEAKCRPPSEG